MKAKNTYINCLNCGAELKPQDQYCRICGQKRLRQKLTLSDFIKDSLSSFLALDGPVILTLRSLFLRPGLMARDYVQGQRVRYLNPVRIYFLSSLLMLFIAGIQRDDPVIATNLNSAPPDTTLSQARIDARIDSLSGIYHLPKAGVFDKVEAIQEVLSLQPQMKKEETLTRLGLPHTALNGFWYKQAWKLQQINVGDFEKEISRSYRSKLLWILFLMVPILALVLKLLYIRKGIYYLSHLSFTFYQQSLLFLLIALASLIPEGNFVFLATGFLALVHQFFALRNFYGQGVFRTLVKLLMYLFAGLIIVILGLAISVVIVFLLL